MGVFVPEEEFRAIKASWRNTGGGRWNWGTSEEQLGRCFANVQEAARREATLRAHDQAWPIGDQRRNGDATTPSLRERISVAVSDQRHWREYLAYWRARCVAEHDHKAAGHEKKQEHDRRLPREADEEEMPF